MVGLDHRRIRGGDFPPPHYPPRLRSRAFLQIHCLTNSWFLTPDTDAMRDALRQFCARFATVNVHGSSMGGYGALLLAEDLHTTQMLLVSPQYSIFPQTVPFDQRFANFAAQLDPALDRVDTIDPEYCRGVLLYDPAIAQDRLHKNLICERFPHLRSVAFTFAGHPALSLVTKEKRFGEVLEILLNAQLPPMAFHALHRQIRRQSKDYLTAVIDYLSARRARSAGH